MRDSRRPPECHRYRQNAPRQRSARIQQQLLRLYNGTRPGSSSDRGTALIHPAALLLGENPGTGDSRICRGRWLPRPASRLPWPSESPLIARYERSAGLNVATTESGCQPATNPGCPAAYSPPHGAQTRRQLSTVAPHPPPASPASSNASGAAPRSPQPTIGQNCSS